jgi:hypothetical protein
MSHLSTIPCRPLGLFIVSISRGCHREYIGNQRVQTPPRESGEFSIPFSSPVDFHLHPNLNLNLNLDLNLNLNLNLNLRLP